MQKEKPKRKRQSRNYTPGLGGCLLIASIFGAVIIFILTVLGPVIGNFSTFMTTDDEGQCQQVIAEIESGSDSPGKISSDELWNGELVPLTSDNAGQLRELNQVGRGYVLNAIETPDKKLLVMTSTGLWQHETPDSDPIKLWDYAAVTKNATFSPTGKWVVLTHYDQDTLLWDTANGKYTALQTAEGEKISLSSHISFSPDETRIAAVTYGIVYVWDTATGKFLAEYPLQTSIYAIAFAPDNTRLAVSFERSIPTTAMDSTPVYEKQRGLHLWNSDTQALETSYPLTDIITQIAFKDAETLLLGTHSNYTNIPKVYQFKLADGSIKNAPVPEMPPSALEMYASSFKQLYPDFRLGVRWLPDNALIPKRPIVNWTRSIYNPNPALPVLHFTPGASSPSVLRVCDTETGKQIKALLLPESSDIYLSPDGTRLWNIENKSIQIYDTETFKPLEKLAQTDFANALLFLPTGEVLAARLNRDDSDAQYLSLWNVRSGIVTQIQLADFFTYNYPLNITLSPDGTRLVMVDNAGVLHVWGVQGK